MSMQTAMPTAHVVVPVDSDSNNNNNHNGDSTPKLQQEDSFARANVLASYSARSALLVRASPVDSATVS